MNTTFPYADFDVSKFMDAFKVPGFDYEALVETQRRNVAAMQEAGAVAGKGFQAIAQRQVEMLQQGFEDAASAAAEVATAATPEDGAKRQIALTQRAVETQTANLREIGEMAQTTGGEVMELVNKRFLEELDAWSPAKAQPKAAKSK
ncbi:MAG: phasin family protein [Alphaproteobacteria bacterium]|jgi:phasin family protein|nr:phasin family protein [Alphaproteobacteria bacterium]